MKTSLTLTPPARKSSTSIHIGSGLRKTLADVVDLSAFDSVVLLSDRGVKTIADEIAAALPGAKRIDVESGDGTKSLSEVDKICARMLELRCTRSTLLVCVGGGMITDLGGFVASIFMRGISCVYIPTSLLAMVDASIGGKTGVNLRDAKNIVGTLSHPAAVVIDTDLIKTLPDAQLSEGLVEVIKIAAVADAGFFGWLETSIDKIFGRDPKAVHECIQRAAGLKARIVEQDETDTVVRLILNFGHTVGHAVEAASAFALSHGKAVSIGMVAEMAMLKFPDAIRVQNLLKKIVMPLQLPKDYAAKDLWKIMQSDKKNSSGKVRVAVPTVIGKAEVRDITEDDFLKLYA